MSSNGSLATGHTKRVCPCLGEKEIHDGTSSRLSSYTAIKLANKLSLSPLRLTAASKETPFQFGEGGRSFHWRIDSSADLNRYLLFQFHSVRPLHTQWQTGPVNARIISGAVVTHSLPPATRHRQIATIIITPPFCRWLLFGRSYYVRLFSFFFSVEGLRPLRSSLLCCAEALPIGLHFTLIRSDQTTASQWGNQLELCHLHQKIKPKNLHAGHTQRFPKYDSRAHLFPVW